MALALASALALALTIALALALAYRIFVSNHNKHIMLSFLERHKCSTALYDTVMRAKRALGIRAEPVRLEASIKGGRDGRYTIHITLSEFESYKVEHQHSLLQLVGCTPSTYRDFMERHWAQPDDDIIFGVDGLVGKLYLDRGHKLYCLQSDGVCKTYVEGPVEPGGPYNRKLAVYADGTLRGYHYYLSKPCAHGPDLLYWIGNNVSGELTYYVRPDVSP